jgi:hypothetical protein
MGMSELLLAHHADDMAENVLLRLARGSSAAGLPGLYPRCSIPENDGVYGVSRSGAPLPMPTISNSSDGGSGGGDDRDDSLRPAMLCMEGGGVDVLRPLLCFRKARLTATCAHYGVRWFEDPSNADVRLTPRNAVRQLLRDDRLPRALSLPALVALALRRLDYRLGVKAEAHALLQRCDVLFDSRVGGIMIRLPRRIRPSDDNYDGGRRRVNDDGDEINGVRVLDVAVEFVKLLAMQVAPDDPGRSKVFISPALCLFPYLRPQHASSPLKGKEKKKKALMVVEEEEEKMLAEEEEEWQDVEGEEIVGEEREERNGQGEKEVQKMQGKEQQQQQTPTAVAAEARSAREDKRRPTISFHARQALFKRIGCRDALSAKHHAALDAHFVWSVSRQPLRDDCAHEFAPLPPSPPDSSPSSSSSSSSSSPSSFSPSSYSSNSSSTRASSSSSSSSSSSAAAWSPWLLWDGRFWVRLRNRSRLPVRLQRLGSLSLSRLRSRLAARRSDSNRQRLTSIAALAPHPVRQTLPALTFTRVAAAAAPTTAAGIEVEVEAEAQAETEPPAVLALPSLDIPRSCALLGGRVQWEIRYKETCFAYKSEIK